MKWSLSVIFLSQDFRFQVSLLTQTKTWLQSLKDLSSHRKCDCQFPRCINKSECKPVKEVDVKPNFVVETRICVSFVTSRG